MKKALIVGINDYPNEPLTGCVNDANAMADVLALNDDDSPNFSVKLCTSPSNTITKSDLRCYIEELFSGDVDIALLYFSGHGFIKSTGGYLVTPDHKKYDEGVSMDDVLSLANKSNAKDKIIIFDCCHSGALGTPSITENNVSCLAEGLSILTASRDLEPAMEIDRSGVFTTLVVEALKGGAADLRGNITPGSMYTYVDQALGAWDQRPLFKTNVTRFTSLRSISPKIPLVILRKIIEYFPTPEFKYPLNPSYEYTDDSAIDDNVSIFKHLQKFQSVDLVVPVGEDHMYCAAMNSKSCRLTVFGYQYWRLVREKKI